MKCHKCGTENEYVRALFRTLECTNTHCQNYSPLAAQDKANGDKGTGEVDEDDDAQMDWGDVLLDFPGVIP